MFGTELNGLTLVCAAIMLVAGQLYIEHRAAYLPGHQLNSPQQRETSPAVISRAPQSHEDTMGPRKDVEKNRAG